LKDKSVLGYTFNMLNPLQEHHH